MGNQNINIVQVSGEIIHPTRREIVVARLAEIDAITTKPRTMRELSLNNAATIAFVTKLDAEAGTLRTELAGLPPV